MRPPASSTALATSPTPRVAVPLNSMCSWKCARPASAGPSSAEPTPAQISTSATGASRASRSSTVTPDDSFSTRIPDKVRGAYPTPRRGAAGLASAGTRRDVVAVPDRTLGVYVHVPFCERVCPYCDFAVVAARRLARAEEERYVAALVAELAARAPLFAGRALETIYFGGGTPALLRPESIGRLVAELRRTFGGAPREVTLEANPSTLERQRLPGFRAAGVDRLSLGVQSFDDGALKRLGRAHRAEESHAALAAARAAGFDNVSLDLIVGEPGQSDASLAGD